VCGQLAEDQINTVVVVAVHFSHLYEKKALLGRYNPAYKAPKLKSYPPRGLHLLTRCPWQMSPPFIYYARGVDFFFYVNKIFGFANVVLEEKKKKNFGSIDRK
jgi:hypothetical protein